jgi:hypothetical protein
VVRRDGGPGRWCWWSAGRGGVAGCRGGGPGSLSVLSASGPCVVWATRLFSVVIVGVVWRSSPGGLTSFLLERPVFAPLIALTASSLQLE